MKLATYSITFAAFLYVASSLPTFNSNSFKKLKLSKLLDTRSLIRRDLSNSKIAKETGYFHGSGYYTEIQIGEPAQSFNVILDTGSADLWVVSTECTSTVNCRKHHQYDTKESSTYQDLHQNISIHYGTGTVETRVGKDTLTIAGITLTDQYVTDATSISDDFKDLPIDGIFGLGLPRLSKTKNAKTLVTSMVEQKQIDKAIFGVYTQPAGGEVDFGGVDTTRYTGPIMTAPVTSTVYWATDMESASIGDYQAGPKSAVIDTGTTLLVVTPEESIEIHKYIEGAVRNSDGTYYIPCDMRGKALPLHIRINGHTLSVPSDDYVLVSTEVGGDLCYSGIVGQTTKPGQWILGSVFLKSYYTIFDYENLELGFAKAVVDPTLSLDAYDE